MNTRHNQTNTRFKSTEDCLDDVLDPEDPEEMFNYQLRYLYEQRLRKSVNPGARKDREATFNHN